MTFRLYTELDVLPAGAPAAPILYPFVGPPPQDPRDPAADRYDRFLARGKEFLALSTLEEADIVVFPVAWEHAKDLPECVDHAHRLARLAAEQGKPFVIFFWSDSADEVPVAPSVVFRTSLYRSHRGARAAQELAMPAWSEDFVDHYQGGEQVIRQKGPRPLVGFCGFDTPIPNLPKRVVKRLLGRTVVSTRGRALKKLAADRRIDTSFVVRAAFFGGHVIAGGPNYEGMAQVRAEFARNMLTSDYALAARGAGNFSYRLYEVMSAGRPPLFVNTDCVLPYDELVDWRSFTIWVDESELDRVADRVVAFHEALSPDDFVELQRECRRIWVEYLSPEGFFRNFHLHFQSERA